MHIRSLLAAGLPALLLSACLHSVSEPVCSARASSQASVSGDTITTTTGLRYIEGLPGAGAAANWCHNVAVNYDAYLSDGTKFDSSRDLGVSLVFAPGLNDLIPGFEEGVVGVRGGGTRRLIIPPELGYGAEPRRNAAGEIIIPGNSTLIYDIEVVQVGE
jgi:FKBP-type peptidyl-prolyl cis-trans isomerase